MPRELKNRTGQVFRDAYALCRARRRAASSPGNPIVRLACGWHLLSGAAPLVTARSFSGVLPRAADQFPDFRMESRITQSSEEEILVNRAIILKSGDRSILLKN
jgi:hypothetical protein